MGQAPLAGGHTTENSPTRAGSFHLASVKPVERALRGDDSEICGREERVTSLAQDLLGPNPSWIVRG